MFECSTGLVMQVVGAEEGVALWKARLVVQMIEKLLGPLHIRAMLFLLLSQVLSPLQV